MQQGLPSLEPMSETSNKMIETSCRNANGLTRSSAYWPRCSLPLPCAAMMRLLRGSPGVKLDVAPPLTGNLSTSAAIAAEAPQRANILAMLPDRRALPEHAAVRRHRCGHERGGTGDLALYARRPTQYLKRGHREHPRRSCSSASRLMTWACTDTSSADTGSSATMNRGFSASARAMPMRWR